MCIIYVYIYTYQCIYIHSVLQCIYKNIILPLTSSQKKKESFHFSTKDLRMILKDSYKVLGFRQNATGNALAPALLEHQLRSIAIRNDPDTLVEASFKAAHLLEPFRSVARPRGELFSPIQKTR